MILALPILDDGDLMLTVVAVGQGYRCGSLRTQNDCRYAHHYHGDARHGEPRHSGLKQARLLLLLRGSRCLLRRSVPGGFLGSRFGRFRLHVYLPSFSNDALH